MTTGAVTSTYSLINPAKDEFGRITKIILDKINVDLHGKTLMSSVGSKTSGTNKIVSLFDNKDFYQPINNKLLLKCLGFAEQKYNFLKMIRK